MGIADPLEISSRDNPRLVGLLRGVDAAGMSAELVLERGGADC